MNGKILAVIISVFFLIAIQNVTGLGRNNDNIKICEKYSFLFWNTCSDPGDIHFDMDVSSSTNDQLCLGVEFDGTYFYVTGAFFGYTHFVHFFSKNGDYVSSAIQSTSDYWGWRDMAFDGTYMYSCAEDNIEKWYVSGLPDSPEIEVVDEFHGPEELNRGLAYDPDTGHFWTANLSSPIYEINTNGDVINTYPNEFEIYGMAWDNSSQGGPFIWMYDQKFSEGHGCHIRQFDPINGVFTGLEYPGEHNADYPLSMAGGACFIDDWDGKSIFVGLTQDDPYDHVFGMEICDFVPESDVQVDSINGGFGITTTIKNNGTTTAYNISWSIDLMGGLIFIGRNSNGQIPMLAPGESIEVGPDLLIGIGRNVLITATTSNSTKDATASWVLGPLVLGIT